jgi:acetyl-CoA C-acetyltransferase
VTPPIYVEGVALEISFADATRNLSELIFDTVRASVDDAGVDMDEIDSIVLAAHDLVDGRSLSSMVTAPAAGAYLRDEIRYSDDGGAAFAGAVTRLEAGDNKRSIVAAWGRSSEHDPDAFSRALFDPFMTRPLGMDEFVLSALRGELLLRSPAAKAAHGQARERRADAAARNPRSLRRGEGFRSAPHYPLNENDLPVWADIVASVVLSTEPTPIKFLGMGQSSEPYLFGDRSLDVIRSLREAADRALLDAGITVEALDVVEIDGLTLIDEALGLEAVRFAQPGDGLRLLAEDDRANPSGGGASGYSRPVMGLARIVEAILQLRGDAGAVQVPGARTALATGSSTVAGQTQTAVVLAAAS